MHLRGQRTSFQTRLKISEHAAAGLHDHQIAALVGCSVWTVRKWRRRVFHQGRVGLTSRMGRPASGPLSTFPRAVKEAILHLRQLHPGWGPNTILAALKADANVRSDPLPSRAQLARFLSHAGLTCHSQPHHDLPQTLDSSRKTSPHLTELTSETALGPGGHDLMRLDGHDLMRLDTRVWPSSATQNEHKQEKPRATTTAMMPQQCETPSNIPASATELSAEPPLLNKHNHENQEKRKGSSPLIFKGGEEKTSLTGEYEVAGQTYYQVSNWKEMQVICYPHPSDYPAPPEEALSSTTVTEDHSATKESSEKAPLQNQENQENQENQIPPPKGGEEKNAGMDKLASELGCSIETIKDLAHEFADISIIGEYEAAKLWYAAHKKPFDLGMFRRWPHNVKPAPIGEDRRPVPCLRLGQMCFQYDFHHKQAKKLIDSHRIIMYEEPGINI